MFSVGSYVGNLSSYGEDFDCDDARSGGGGGFGDSRLFSPTYRIPTGSHHSQHQPSHFNYITQQNGEIRVSNHSHQHSNRYSPIIPGKNHPSRRTPLQHQPPMSPHQGSNSRVITPNNNSSFLFKAEAAAANNQYHLAKSPSVSPLLVHQHNTHTNPRHYIPNPVFSSSEPTKPDLLNDSNTDDDSSSSHNYLSSGFLAQHYPNLNQSSFLGSGDEMDCQSSDDDPKRSDTITTSKQEDTQKTVSSRSSSSSPPPPRPEPPQVISSA